MISSAGQGIGQLLTSLMSSSLTTKQAAQQAAAGLTNLQKAGSQCANSFVQLTQAAQQATTIYQTSKGAFDILLSSIGTLLTPVIGVLAAGFLQLADFVVNKILPAFQALYDFLGSKGLLGAAVGGAVGGTVGGIAGTAGGAIGGAAIGSAILPGIGTVAGGAIGAWLGGTVGATTGAVGGAVLGGLGGKAVGEATKTNNREPWPGANEYLEMVRQQMVVGLGKQGQVGFSGIADVWKQVQMKSFMSPFEQMNLKLMQRQIQMLEQMIIKFGGRDTGVTKVGGTK